MPTFKLTPCHEFTDLNSSTRQQEGEEREEESSANINLNHIGLRFDNNEDNNKNNEFPIVPKVRSCDPSTLDFVDISRNSAIQSTFSLLPSEGDITTVSLLRCVSPAAAASNSNFNSSSARTAMSVSTVFAFIGTSRGWHLLVTTVNSDVLWIERKVSVTAVCASCVAPWNETQLALASSSAFRKSKSTSAYSSPALCVMHENGLCAVYIADQFESICLKAISKLSSSLNSSSSSSSFAQNRIFVTLFERKILQQKPADDPEIREFYSSHHSMFPKTVVNLGTSLRFPSCVALKAACVLTDYREDATLTVFSSRSNISRLTLWIGNAIVGVWSAWILVDSSPALATIDMSENKNESVGKKGSSAFEQALSTITSSSGSQNRGVATRVADAAMSMLAQRVFHSKTVADVMNSPTSTSLSMSIDKFPSVPFSLCIPPPCDLEEQQKAEFSQKEKAEENAALMILPALNQSPIDEPVCLVHFAKQGRALVLINDIVVRVLRGVADSLCFWVRPEKIEQVQQRNEEQEEENEISVPPLVLIVLHKKRQILEAYDVLAPGINDSRRIAACKIRKLVSNHNSNSNNNKKKEKEEKSNKSKKLEVDFSLVSCSSYADATGSMICLRNKSDSTCTWFDISLLSSSSSSFSVDQSEDQQQQEETSETSLGRRGSSTGSRSLTPRRAGGGGSGAKRTATPRSSRFASSRFPSLSLTSSNKEIDSAIRFLLVSSSSSSASQPAFTLRDLILKLLSDSVYPSASKQEKEKEEGEGEDPNKFLHQLQLIVQNLAHRFVLTVSGKKPTQESGNEKREQEEEIDDEEYFAVISKSENAIARQLLIVLDGLRSASNSANVASLKSSTMFRFSKTELKETEKESEKESQKEGQKESETEKSSSSSSSTPSRKMLSWSFNVFSGTQRAIGDPSMIASQLSAHSSGTVAFDSRSERALQMVRDSITLTKLDEELNEIILEKESSSDEKKEKEVEKENQDEKEQEQQEQEELVNGPWILRLFRFTETIQLPIASSSPSSSSSSSSSSNNNNNSILASVFLEKDIQFLKDISTLGRVLFGQIPLRDAVKIIRSPPRAMTAAGIRAEEASFAFLAFLIFSADPFGKKNNNNNKNSQHGQIHSLLEALPSENDFRRFISIIGSLLPFPCLRFLCLHSKLSDNSNQILHWICVLRIASKIDNAVRQGSSSSTSSATFDASEVDFLCTYVRTSVALSAVVKSVILTTPKKAEEEQKEDEEKQEVDEEEEEEKERKKSTSSNSATKEMLDSPQLGKLSVFGGSFSAFTAFARSSPNLNSQQKEGFSSWLENAIQFSSLWSASCVEQQAEKQQHTQTTSSSSSSAPRNELSDIKSIIQLCSLSLHHLYNSSSSSASSFLLYQDLELETVQNLCSHLSGCVRLVDKIARRLMVRIKSSTPITAPGQDDASREFEFKVIGALCLAACSAAVARQCLGKFWQDVALSRTCEVLLLRRRDGTKQTRETSSKILSPLLDLTEYAMESLQSNLMRLVGFLRSEVAKQYCEHVMFLPMMDNNNNNNEAEGEEQAHQQQNFGFLSSEDAKTLLAVIVAKFVSTDAGLSIPRASPALIREFSALAQTENLSISLPLLPQPSLTSSSSFSSNAAAASSSSSGVGVLSPTSSSGSLTTAASGGGGSGGLSSSQIDQQHQHQPSEMLFGVLQAGLQTAVNNVVFEVDGHVRSSPSACLRIIAALRVILKFPSTFRQAASSSFSTSSFSDGRPLSMSQLLLCEPLDNNNFFFDSNANNNTNQLGNSSSSDDSYEDEDEDSDEEMNTTASFSSSSSSSGEEVETIETLLAVREGAPHVRVISRIASALSENSTLKTDDYQALLDYDAAWRGGSKTRASAEIMAQSAYFVWAYALRHALLRQHDDLALRDLIKRVHHKAVIVFIVLHELRLRLLLVIKKLDKAADDSSNMAAQRSANDVLLSIPQDLKKWCWDLVMSSQEEKELEQEQEKAKRGISSSSKRSRRKRQLLLKGKITESQLAHRGKSVKISKEFLSSCATLAARVLEQRPNSNEDSAKAKKLHSAFIELIARFS